jgi:hypothetical protein
VFKEDAFFEGLQLTFEGGVIDCLNGLEFRWAGFELLKQKKTLQWWNEHVCLHMDGENI